MTIEILQTFYQQMMPLYTPQAEKILETAQAEKFKDLSFRYTFSVEAMTKISHIIEDAVINTPRVASLHASFQYLSRLVPQQERYMTIASNAHSLWLYYETDVATASVQPLLEAPAVTTIDTANTPLVNYWFVIAYGGGIHMTLLAQEIPSLDGDERYYEGFYTFEQDAAFQILTILSKIYPDKVPLPIPSDFEPYR